MHFVNSCVLIISENDIFNDFNVRGKNQSLIRKKYFFLT